MPHFWNNFPSHESFLPHKFSLESLQNKWKCHFEKSFLSYKKYGGRKCNLNICLFLDPTQPVVANIELADYSDTDITISWTQTHEFDQWALSILPDGSTAQAIIITKADNKHSHTFSDLTEGTVYEIKMITHSHSCVSTPLVFTHKTS